MFINKKEAAKYLGLSFRTLEHWAQKGKNIPVYRVGDGKENRRKIMYKMSDLEKYMEERRREIRIAFND